VSESFLDGKVTLHRGDCLEVLPLLEANSIDSCVTDPPYHLTSIVKRYSNGDAKTENSIKLHGTQKVSPYMRGAKGFMGKQWDGGDIAFRPETWAEVLRVLKPGAHLIAFSGTRTYHRMACAIEDAGFEIRDQIGWCYGSGFPKSHNIGNGWGSALKPAWEPIVLARKPLSESSIAANVLKHGTGGINVDGCRVGVASDDANHRHNPSEGNGGANSIFGVGGHNGNLQATGRWPANLIHDGSEEVLAGFPESDGCQPHTINSANAVYDGWGSITNKNGETVGYSGKGSAARFFYTAKADADDRLGSKHPTVKPLDLIQYLVRLITPLGGCVLDPFAGTGTCGEAAFREGAKAVLVEREAEYQADIVKRMGLCLSGPEERRAASVKQLPPDDLPMFGGGI
jgi:site-specific DNA-methyltransferase (adenine-specific)